MDSLKVKGLSYRLISPLIIEATTITAMTKSIAHNHCFAFAFQIISLPLFRPYVS